MTEIKTMDDLRAALGVENFRQMSSTKVFELSQMMQKGQVSAAVQSELLLIAPDTMVKLAQAMDESVQEAIGSNDQSSDYLNKQFAMTKRTLIRIAENPNTTDEARLDVLNRLERYDNKLLEHDVNNKRFNLEALNIKKETVLTVALVAASGVAIALPGGRKWLTENGGKLLADATRRALPGK